ncbi:unnamed protein product [Rhizoctonia solani]|uniref:Uncharacterized protein n=1 Tax=Rhizoctonia solani TaxID=456999 RepID=A0A8H3ANY2_9AGAM|nr:unnamed protein product [Rhizoctonia solani]
MAAAASREIQLLYPSLHQAAIAATTYAVTGVNPNIHLPPTKVLQPTNHKLVAPHLTVYKGELHKSTLGKIVGIGIPGNRIDHEHRKLPEYFLRIDYIPLPWKDIPPPNDKRYPKFKEDYDAKVKSLRNQNPPHYVGIHFNARYLHDGVIVESDDHPAFAAYVDRTGEYPIDLQTKFDQYVKHLQRKGATTIWDKWVKGETY